MRSMKITSKRIIQNKSCNEYTIIVVDSQLTTQHVIKHQLFFFCNLIIAITI